MSTAAINKALVKTLYEDCINGRDLDRLETLIAPDFVGARGERGPREFRATIEAVLTGFPGVRFDVHDLIGGYATAEANAGAGEASKAQVVTKGGISLALTGKGSGHTLGVSFGSFVISARK